MNRLTLANRLKAIIIGAAICGLILYAFLLPYLGRQLFPDTPLAFWGYLCFLWISGIPCYAVLIFAWRIAHNIGLDRSFTEENAVLLRRISTLAAVDAGYIFIGNPILILLGVGHELFVLLSVIIVFAGIAVSVAAAALSHLVLRAAELQEQSDLTI